MLKAREVAERCGVHLRTVRVWISSGQLPVLRLGKRCLRIDAREFDRFLERARAEQ
jgi:excisionase family DNA binding protein